jgi:NO-binding membrane sensor protein with MHYT domain
VAVVVGFTVVFPPPNSSIGSSVVVALIASLLSLQVLFHSQRCKEGRFVSEAILTSAIITIHPV